MSVSDRRVSLVFEGSEGTSSLFMKIGGLLQQRGYRVSMVGPVDYQARAQNLGLAYVALPGLEYKTIMTHSRAVEAVGAGDLPALVHFLDEEQSRIQEQSLYTLCQALKGFEPGLVLCSSRPLHYALAIGNALCLPVLQLTFQSPAIQGVPMVGDYLDQPSWYGQKERQVAKFLSKSESQVGALFGQWLGAAAKFWPTPRQLLALAGPQPEFPLLQSRSMTSIFAEMRSWCPDRYFETPKLNMFRQLPDNVWEVLPFHIDLMSELTLPEFSKEESLMIESLMTTDEQPVLFTFGFLTAGHAAETTQLCVRSLYSTQLKGIIEAGPTGLCLNHLDGMGQEESILKEYCERNVVFVKSVCLARILPRASVVVHDGSTFLSRFCMENNRPQIVLPVFGEGQTNASNVVNLWIGRSSPSLQSTTPQWLADSLYRIAFEQDTGFFYDYKWMWERFDEEFLKNFIKSPKGVKMSSFINYRWQSWKTSNYLKLTSGPGARDEAFASKLGDYWEKSISTGIHLQRMEDIRAAVGRRCCCGPAAAKRVQEEP